MNNATIQFRVSMNPDACAIRAYVAQARMPMLYKQSNLSVLRTCHGMACVGQPQLLNQPLALTASILACDLLYTHAKAAAVAATAAAVTASTTTPNCKHHSM
jgi:hypothetical protein